MCQVNYCFVTLHDVHAEGKYYDFEDAYMSINLNQTYFGYEYNYEVHNIVVLGQYMLTFNTMCIRNADSALMIHPKITTVHLIIAFIIVSLNPTQIIHIHTHTN